MKCTRCGAEAQNINAKFCPKCGNPLQLQHELHQPPLTSPENIACSQPPTQPQIPDAALPIYNPAPSFTANPAPIAAPAEAPAEAPKKKRKLALVLVSVFAIALLLGAAIYALPKLLGNSNRSSGSGTEDSSASDNYSKSEQKEIDAIVEEAKKLSAQGNYKAALEKINAGLVAYPESADLLQKSREYTDEINAQVKAATLKEAEQLAASGDYLGAMQIISYAQGNGFEDEDYSNAYDQYSKAYNAQIKQEAISEAEAYANAGDYLSALTVIDTTISRCGNDETLKKLLATYSDAYVAKVLVQVDTHIQNSQFDKAHALLDSAATAVPNNKSLQAKQDELAQYKSVSLSSLTAINGGFAWNEGAPEDPFGNDYSTVNNYTILHGNYCSGNYTLYSEFRLSKAYTELTFNYAPYSDFGENATSYIQVYVDGVLRYTTPKITRKSGLQTVQLDICDADYVEIVVKKGDRGCVLISDAMLTSTPNHVCEAKSKVSLSTLSVLNGDAPWENDYPTDNLGGTYFNSSNYIVFHGNYCSGSYTLYAEYYINGKYSTLDFSAAPYDNFDEKATSIVCVYVDDVLVYTATITGKTAKIDSGAIDLLGATYLKIVVDKNDYGCIILSNLMLTPKG